MRTLIIVALLAAFLCSLAVSGAEDNAQLAVTETVLCEISDKEVDNLIVSPDHKRVAFVKKMDKGSCVVADGKDGKTYSEVGKPFFSPDGKKMAYAAFDGKSWIMVEDGKVGAKYEKISPEIALYTPDSKEVAYVAKKDGKEMVVVGKKELKAYKKVTEIRYSKDGKHMACHVLDYIASTAIQGSGMDQSFWSIDGSDMTDFCRPMGFVMSPDGKHWALLGSTARIGEMVDINDLGTFVIVDGEKKEKLTTLGTNSFSDFFVFSNDGKRLMYAYRDEKSYFISLDKKKYGPYEYAVPGCFTPSGKRACWTVETDDKVGFYVDGKELKISDLEEGLSSACVAFNGDSNIAFRTNVGDECAMVEDGKVLCRYKLISKPMYNAKGELCYIAWDGTNTICVRKGETRYEVACKMYGGGFRASIANYVLSANGEGFACFCDGEEGKMLMVNGGLSGEYKTIIESENPALRVGDPMYEPMFDKGENPTRPKLPDNLPPGVNRDDIKETKENNWTDHSLLAINGDTVNFITVKDGKLLKCEAKVK
jgi:hypothetical protein